jgi:hypothetical protein
VWVAVVSTQLSDERHKGTCFEVGEPFKSDLHDSFEAEREDGRGWRRPGQETGIGEAKPLCTGSEDPVLSSQRLRPRVPGEHLDPPTTPRPLTLFVHLCGPSNSRHCLDGRKAGARGRGSPLAAQPRPWEHGRTLGRQSLVAVRSETRTRQDVGRTHPCSGLGAEPRQLPACIKADRGVYNYVALCECHVTSSPANQLALSGANWPSTRHEMDSV